MSLLKIKISKYVLVNTLNVLLLSTFLFIYQSCTDHDNPFDPQNDKKGEPFNLMATTGYGKIHLEWNWPAYPVDGGSPIPLDSFLLFREDAYHKLDTLSVHLQTVFEDTGVVGDLMYQYQVSAFRNDSQSDRSAPVSTYAYPLPLESFFIAHTTVNEKWAIDFLGSIKFIMEGEFIRVLDANDIQIAYDVAYNGIDDIAIINSTQRDSVYIYVCSELFGKVKVFLWSLDSLKPISETDTFADFRKMAVDSTRNLVYVVDGYTYDIFKFKVGKSDPIPTNMRSRIDPQRLLVLSNPPRLFCANKGLNSVSIFDLATESLLYEIQVKEEPLDLWIGPNSNLYVVCAGAGRVIIIDPIGCEIIAEIIILDPITGRRLSPRSITGFTDPQNRHSGVLAVAAACMPGDNCDSPGFLLYYSINDLKLQRYLKFPYDTDPYNSSFVSRVNPGDHRIYTVLRDKVWVCKFKSK